MVAGGRDVVPQDQKAEKGLQKVMYKLCRIVESDPQANQR